MIVNLTPHAIDLYPPGVPTTLRPEDYPYATFDPAGRSARIAEEVVGDVAPQPGMPGFTLVEYGHVIDLPEPVEGTAYVVSLPVALALPGRRDLLVPWRQVRNTAGTVVGCRGLARPVPVS